MMVIVFKQDLNPAWKFWIGILYVNGYRFKKKQWFTGCSEQKANNPCKTEGILSTFVGKSNYYMKHLYCVDCCDDQ